MVYPDRGNSRRIETARKLSPIMDFAREWLILKKIPSAVAIAAVVVVVDGMIWHTGPEIYATASAVAAGVFALGAMRAPWFFLATAVLANVASPRVFDCSAHDLFQASYQMSSILGAVAGKVIRMVRARGATLPAAPKPSSSKSWDEV
jgi:hypothetical protein